MTYELVNDKPISNILSARWYRQDNLHLYSRTVPKTDKEQAEYVRIAFGIFRGQIEPQNWAPWILYPKNGFQEPTKGSEDGIFRPQHIIVSSYGGLLKTGSQPEASFEAYCIQVNKNGSWTIFLRSPLDANSAFTTLLQFFFAHSTLSGERYCSTMPLTIRDEPRFLHQGLHIDISRNVILPKDTKKILNGMWLNKMSRLRIHATDTQSWPLDISSIPELAQKEAYHAGHIWSSEAPKEVQQHGYDRGVEVYLELDMPGHTGSIHHSFPDLILAYNLQRWEECAAEPPAGQFRLNSEEVRESVSAKYRDLLPRVALLSSVFNVRGDELNTSCYCVEEGIESNSKDVIRPFLQKFFDNIFPLLEEYGLDPILWEEVLLEWDLKFPPNTIFQTWKVDESIPGSTNASVDAVVKRGYRAIFGPCSEWYLDLGFGTWIDSDPQRAHSQIKYPYADWGPHYKTWKRVSTYDPFDVVDAEHHTQILDGGMHTWCELTDAVNLESRL